MMNNNKCCECNKRIWFWQRAIFRGTAVAAHAKCAVRGVARRKIDDQ